MQAGPGRPPIQRTPELETLILESLGAWPAMSRAAARAGVSARTLGRWMADDEFGARCEAAAWKACDRLLGEMHGAARDGLTWQHVAWTLERMRPGDFSRNRAENDSTSAPPPPKIIVTVAPKDEPPE